MTAICPSAGCGYPAKDEKALAAHSKFKHGATDVTPVVTDQPTLKAPRTRIRKRGPVDPPAPRPRAIAKPKPILPPKPPTNAVCVECGDPVYTSKDVVTHAVLHQRGTDSLAVVPEAKAKAEPVEVVRPEPLPAGVFVSPRRKPAKARAATKVEAAALDIPIYPTREAWMLAAVDAMRPWYVEAGLNPVPEVRISVGWAGGRGSKKGVRGQCCASHTTSDKKPAIFVTPDQDDPLTILGIVLHEMNHASDDGVSGHKGTFAKQAEKLGFEKPWTSSEGKNQELTERLTALLKDLGVFPHGRITDKTHGLTGLLGGPGGAPVQTTRMLKVQCESCGCIIRMTQKWINEAGTPTCGCGGTMIQEAGDATLARLLGI